MKRFSFRTVAVLAFLAVALLPVLSLAGCGQKSQVSSNDLPPLGNPGAPTYKTNGRPVVLEFSATW